MNLSAVVRWRSGERNRCAEEGNERQREEEREEHRNGEGEAEGREEIAHHAFQQAQGSEHHHGRGRGADHRAQQLLRSLFRRFGGRLAQSEMAVDVFNDHHRVVNDQPDGDGDPSQRHQVERAAEQVHEEECADDGEGKGNGGDQSGAAFAQKKEENNYGENASDQDGVADAGHRLAHEFRHVINHGKMQRFRNGRAQVFRQRFGLVRHLQNVAPDLA